MRTTFIIPLLFCISACNKAELPTPIVSTAGEDPDKKANDLRDSYLLPTNLTLAGNDLDEIIGVYKDAVKFKNDKIRKEADERLTAVAMPQATWLKRIKKLQRQVPTDSQTWQRLEAKRRALQPPDPI